MVGGIGPDDGPGPTLIDRERDEGAGELTSRGGRGGAVGRDKARARRRRRAEMHDHADEFADMNVEVDPDWGARSNGEPVVSTVGLGSGCGFAGVRRDGGQDSCR